MAQTNAERSELTQTRILEAATRLTRLHGWENTKVKDICAEADVSIGAFYHHFASKQELMQRAFLFFDATLAERLPVPDTEPFSAIRALLLTQTAFIVDEAGPVITEYYKNILMDEKRAAVDPSRAYYQNVRAYAELAHEQGILHTDYTPREATELLISFVRGCIVDWCLHDCAYDLLARAAKGLDLVIGGLKA